MRCVQGDFNSIKVRLKLRFACSASFTFRYFNSIKVRLKQGGRTGNHGRRRFQFHKGTIKTFSSKKLIKCFFSYFNSIKVRLKQTLGAGGYHLFTNFNSIKVRLKLLILLRAFFFSKISIP